MVYPAHLPIEHYGLYKASIDLITKMAAPKYTDRLRAQELRSLALTEMINALKSQEDPEFKKALLIKLAGSVLPRLSEVTGENGEAMKITIEIAGSIAKKNELT